MDNQLPFSKEELFSFIDKAGKATYAGGGEEVKTPERPGFTEYEYTDGDFHYRDSYTGWFRSRGMEVVRYKGIPVWVCEYGGGMMEGKKDISHDTFEFLKKAMSVDESGFDSLRGPREFTDGDWKYTYAQNGDVFELWGYEEISYKGEVVFFHRTIGGIVIDK